MALVESKLEGRDFVASNDTITAADITLIYPIEEVLKEDDDAVSKDKNMQKNYPRCEAWRQRMYLRDAHKRAMAKVGETN